MIMQIPSILDFQNRQALARQGFYGNQYKTHSSLTTSNHRSESTSSSRGGKVRQASLSAAEKRKAFQYRVKSKSRNWSLTEEGPDGGMEERPGPRESVDSWTRGLILKSFSDRYKLSHMLLFCTVTDMFCYGCWPFKTGLMSFLWHSKLLICYNY